MALLTEQNPQISHPFRASNIIFVLKDEVLLRDPHMIRFLHHTGAFRRQLHPLDGILAG